MCGGGKICYTTYMPEPKSKRWWADWAELFALPAVAMLLPRPLTGWYWRAVIRFTAAYQMEADLAQQGRARLGLATEPNWIRRFRLQRALETGDAWRALRALLGWRDFTVYPLQQNGSWPKDKPVLALTLHWGQGMATIQGLTAAGHRAGFLTAKVTPDAYGEHVWRYRYAKLRMWVTARLGGAGVVMTGGAFAKMQAAMNEGSSMIGLYDVPSHLVGETEVFELAGYQLRLPIGLAQLAVSAQVPVVFFRAGYDLADQIYAVRVIELGKFSETRPLLQALAQQFEAALQQDDAQWHTWQHADALLTLK
jgi:hypothetical protein